MVSKLSPLSSNGAENNGIKLYELPTDALSKILNYLPDQASLSQVSLTCKDLNAVIIEERRHYFNQVKSHPMLQFLSEHLPAAIQGNTYKEKSIALESFLLKAKRLKDLTLGHTPRGRYVHLLFSRDAASLRALYESGEADQQVNGKFNLRDLCKIANKIGFDDLFLAAVFEGDDAIISKFNPEVMQRETVDFAAYLALIQGKIDLFKELLPYTSIYGPDTHDNVIDHSRRKDVFETYLIEAARLGHHNLFLNLLGRNGPYDVNFILVSLAKENRHEAIRSLLERFPVDGVFWARNGYNDINSGAPGVHTALLKAANRNHIASIRAIFEALPGNQIDRRILEQIRDIFLNHPPEFEDDLSFSEWEVRENHPDRDAIVLLFNEEIAARYPEPPEEALPAELEEEQLPVEEADEIAPEIPIQMEEDLGQNWGRIGMVAAVAFGLLWQLASYGNS